MTTEEKLNKLSEMQSKRDDMLFAKNHDMAMAIPPEVREVLKNIEYEYNLAIVAHEAEMEALKEEIQADVLAGGKTVKGQYLMALWVKGRSGGWDSAKLEGFALVHPEILKAKKPDGEPTVSFRAVGK